LQYRWDFDNDGFWDTPFASTPMATHIWNDEYEGNALLEVFDGVFKDVDEFKVKIHNAPPDVHAGSDATADDGSSVSFLGSFTDPGTEDGPFTIEWDFGDGGPPVTGS